MLLLLSVARILISFFLVTLQSGAGFQAGPDQIQIQRDQASVNFPDRITFQMAVHASAPIQIASLRYGIIGRTCGTGTSYQNMKFSPGTDLALTWTWDLRATNLYLPPGAQIWWQWLIHTQDEQSLLTDKQIVTIANPDHDWQILDTEAIHLEWFDGNLEFGRSLLKRASQSAARLALETGLAFPEPIRLVVYPDGASIQSATPNLPEWTGGVAFPEHGTVLAAIPPDQLEWGDLVIPHEIAHLILAERVFNCRGAGLPLWFVEGFSKFAEEPLNDEQRAVLLLGLENGDLPALRDLADRFPYETGPASQAYLVSLAAVNELLETGESQPFSKLLAQIRAGESFDQALLELYGYRVDTLDQAWRARLGSGQAPEGQAPDPLLNEGRPVQGPSPQAGPDFPLFPEFGWVIKPATVILALLILTAVSVLVWWRSQLMRK